MRRAAARDPGRGLDGTERHGDGGDGGMSTSLAINSALRRRAEVSAPARPMMPSSARPRWLRRMLRGRRSVGRARQRADVFKGLRLSEVEKQRRLAKLTADLRQARARVEVRRRRDRGRDRRGDAAVGDDRSERLAPPDTLAATAGAEVTTKQTVDVIVLDRATLSTRRSTGTRSRRNVRCRSKGKHSMAT